MLELAGFVAIETFHKGPDFANFWDFGFLVNFWIFGPKMGPFGPGRASIGSRDILGPIGPLLFFKFLKKHVWSK